MAVKIVTDSLSDIDGDLAKKLGVTVVPLSVLFGREAFLDRVTITTDEFYRRLSADSVWPTTTQPTPAAFLDVYKNLAKETDEILVLTLTRKFSGTYDSAIGARNNFKGKARIEVVDSQAVGMGLGLVVISASKKAKAGATLDELLKWTNKAISRSHFVIYFDTLKYLAKGGRIGKAQSLLGSIVSVKPIVTIKDGEIAPLTRLRSLSAGMDYLYNFVAGYPDAEAVAVEYTTLPNEADNLVSRLTAVFAKERIYKSTVSPVLGVYGGPGAMAAAVLEAEKK